MQAVRLPGEALTLSLAAALLCSGCTPLPPGDQSASASQVSTVSTSLSQVYYRFERNGVDVSGLIPGDPVTVTYTGALDPEEGTVSAVLLSITKDTL